MSESWSSNELKDLLSEELEFLRSSCENFDNGRISECKRLATTVRVLLHDTNNSTSLFKQLGLKGKDFFDSAIPYDDRNLMSHSSLVIMAMGGKDNGVYPLLDEGPSSGKSIPFDTWWNGIVFVDKNRKEFSRRDIVVNLANKDGGAHVDSVGLPVDYKNLTRNNSLGWTTLKNGEEIPAENQVPAAMRQIAHELLKTLDSQYTCCRKELDVGMWVLGASLFAGEMQYTDINEGNLTKNRPMVTDGKKIGRNDPCHCGSGLKYKKCHL